MVPHRKWPPFTWNVARAIYIMWSKHLQSLKLLHPTIKVEMYLQENIVYELDCDIEVTWNIAKNSEYDQEIPQSKTADNPVAPRGRAAQPSSYE